ncbi:MAG: LamG domain-containing protein [Myxococcales bacterium]
MRLTLLLICVASCGPAPIDAGGVPPSTLAQGLIAHWSFDELTGTKVTDRSGNGHDGVTSPTPGWGAEGRFGAGLRLQTSDSVSFLAFAPTITAAMPGLTVSGWIKLSEADRMMFPRDRAVLLTSEQSGGWEIEFDPRDGFDWLEASYSVPSIGDYVILRCKCIDLDVWMHWAVVFDSMQNRFTLYRDGVSVDTSKLAAAGPPLPGSPELFIGKWYQGPRPIPGVIDDYAIWSRALTAEEIFTVHTRGVPDPL